MRRALDCAHRTATLTRCEVTVRRMPVGSEAWHCEFKDDGTSGVTSCWTEDGPPDSLRDPAQRRAFRR